MTKKHFKAIAEIIKQKRESTLGESPYEQGIDHATYDFALSLSNYFVSDNPLFDRAKFLTACGIE